MRVSAMIAHRPITKQPMNNSTSTIAVAGEVGFISGALRATA